MSRIHVTAHALEEKGHASLVSHGDDGKVHITAYRRRGKQGLVEVGSYSIDLEELAKLMEHRKKESSSG